MNIAGFSIKRPIFITCIVASIILFGGLSYTRLGVDLMPSVDFPVVMVSTTYDGAAPEEVATQISKVLEDEISAIGGIKHLNSTSTEGVSTISVEFGMDVDIDKALQDVRDKVSIAKNSLPDDADDPVVQKMDPDSFPVMKTVLFADLSAGEIYDLANEVIKPQLSRIDGVAQITIVGGTRRQIQVEVDQKKLNDYSVSLSTVVSALKSSGSNVAVGSKEEGKTKTVYRAMAEFTSLDQIANNTVSFAGDIGNSVSVKKLATVKDSLEDATSIGYVYYPTPKEGEKSVAPEHVKTGERIPCVYLTITKQSGSNSVKVSNDIHAQLEKINATLKSAKGSPNISIILDTTKWIKTNVSEAVSSIFIGIFLAIVVVYLFLGNIRSTLITAVAIPNSLLGAFIIMNLMGYTLNLMTLMALSLTVGLLVDDAIVVRENIFRKLESGMSPREASERGTNEVVMAVIATTATVMAVFIPMGTISGITGNFLAQFGLTVVFAMAVSLFDALTVAPFLSAYFAGTGKRRGNVVVRTMERFQIWLDNLYTRIMTACLKHPLKVILVSVLVFISSLGVLGFVKKSFYPTGGDEGQFAIGITMPAGTSLEGTASVIKSMEEKVRTISDLSYYSVSVGSSSDPTTGEIDIFLKKDRKKDTEEIKAEVRKFLPDYAYATPKVGSLSTTSSGMRTPFQMVISGHDLTSVEKTASEVFDQLKQVKQLVEIDTSMKKGNPEFRVNLDPSKMQNLGVSPSDAGNELRYSIAGATPAQFHANGVEYDILVRFQENQRNLKSTYSSMRVPNVSGNMVPLHLISTPFTTTGSAAVYRQDKGYVVKLTGNLAPGWGVGDAMTNANELIKKNVVVPQGVTVGYTGQSEDMGETVSQIIIALLLALVFIYMVLASLYESFFTPFTILLAIPPAMTGALFALLMFDKMLDMFSMIGLLMLMGLVTKNSILLVDFALEGVRSGMDRKEAILQAGKKRLRPIFMTTFAMLAGTLPLALGLGEAAAMRQSMGIAIIGGLILSTVITLVVVPAVFEYVDRIREVVESKFRLKDVLPKLKKSK